MFKVCRTIGMSKIQFLNFSVTERVDERLTKKKKGIATISSNPNENKGKAGETTISVNSSKTSRANDKNEDNKKINE